eukprot:TRINITY_DN4303_c0_g1_i1.p1 TRINITY_DN4303_c0_g1~~TRINITY_DN4303_c0_g1_i1.p1  ORF type:complete len:308 (+),score=46.13 TRINITY_DN4303_c0_g1_i1:25-924(+)
MEERKPSKATLISLFLFVVIEVLGFSIVLPLLPYLVQYYGMTPTQAGLLQSSNALAQLIAVPFIGALSDQYGRKPLLILCIAGTFTSFMILAQAKSTFWVFFSRILDGIIGGNISLVHAYVSDITDESNRSQGLGMIGAAFGLGFVVGPALGGIMVKYSPQAPSYLAAALSLLNLVMALIFLKESLPAEKRVVISERESIFGPLVRQVQDSFWDHRTSRALWLRFLYLIAFTAFETTFGFFNKALGNDARTAGYLLCWFGIIYSMIQGGGMKALKARFLEDDLLRWSLVILAVFYLSYG